jgi:hypothetical protein
VGLARTLAFAIMLTLAGLAPWGSSVSAPALPNGEQRPRPLVGHPVSAPPPQREPPTPERGVFGAMLKAIRVSSPPHLDMTFEADRLDGDWRLDGTVADGSGPGNLLVDLTVRPGMLQSHPCADAEFRRRATCVERSLPDGDLLVLRDLVVERGGMKTIEVVLVHPDRSGVAAEAGNWTLAPLAEGTSVSQSELPMPRVTRSSLVYSVQQLGRLVQAVDVRARRCIRAGCG